MIHKLSKIKIITGGIVIFLLGLISGLVVSKNLADKIIEQNKNQNLQKVAGENIRLEDYKEEEHEEKIKNQDQDIEESQTQLQEKKLFFVPRVIDGDTIELENGLRIRYIGIDTPEISSKNKGVECFALEALSKNKELVEGKMVRLEKDISEQDRYGRLLRYVYLDDVFVNLELISLGYAYAITFPPDIKYENLFREAEREAREEKIGLWGKECENYIPPVITSYQQESKPPSEDCLIKGNVSIFGNEKIYHLPSCQYWEETVIDPRRGEKWFCTEEEAQKAGFRKAKNCL